MKPIAIMAPLPVSAVSVGAGTPAANLLTPDPREVFAQGGGGTFNVDFDFGANASLDSIFIGYVGNAPGFQIISASYGLDGGSITDTATPINYVSLLTSSIANPLYRHAFYRFSAPITARYVRLNLNSEVNAVMTIGVIAFGLSFVPQYGVDYGAGRLLTDSGDAERLFGGSFGLDPGAVIGGYSFTLANLQSAERAALYRIVRGLGQTRSVLVLEDSDTTGPINEGVHWGLFQKFEAYERTDALNTKWSLQIADWL